MVEKTYRPKAEVENLSLTVQAEGKAVDIASWPYKTDDPAKQRALDEHPLVTDRPAPKQSKN